MNTVDWKILYRTKTSVGFDLLALTFIYFVPALSHWLNLPLYLIEPMRIMLILALLHTHKNNAYLIALTLPVFSYAISGHPFILKTLLISLELVLNVWFFFFFGRMVRNRFLAMFSAIVASKLVYYMLKYLLISTLLIHGSLFSTPLLIQCLVGIILSVYTLFAFKRKSF